jgi:cysteine sulfinate desulfinase/cysteine desulfurase-like protein
MKGGGQERGQRAGTENVAAIAGFGAAAAAATRTDTERVAAMRDRLEQGLRRVTPDVQIFGDRETRLPNTTLFRGSRRQGGNRHNCLRSQRDSCVLWLGLLVREGPALGGSGGHGC